MSQVFYPREEVASRFAVSVSTLIRFEERGLVRPSTGPTGAGPGYGPAEVRRLATIVCYHRDLGVNLAGIEMILHLLDQRRELHGRMGRLSDRLNRAVDAAFGDAPEHDADAW